MAFFSLKKNTDQDIVLGIREGGTRRQFFENTLYHKYTYLIREAIWKHKIEEETASIAYSDTILTIIEHIISGRFEGRSELKTYIYQIFSNKCVDVIRKKTTNKLYAISIDDLIEPIPDNQRSALMDLIRQQDHERLRKMLKNLGERCQELLKRWSEDGTDEESAKEFGYNSAGVVQTTRLRCLEKLREMYKNKSTR